MLVAFAMPCLDSAYRVACWNAKEMPMVVSWRFRGVFTMKGQSLEGGHFKEEACEQLVWGPGTGHLR